MNSRKIVFALTILAMVSMATVFVSVPKVLAQGTIFITPTVIDDVSIAPGAQVKYNASAADVAGVFTWQVQLTYDPSVLNCTGAGVAPGSLFNFEVDVTPVIDNFAGTVTLGSTQLMAEPVSGSGVMAMFNFTVLSRGYSHVNYSRPLGADTYLLDNVGHDIPVTLEDASFNNYIPPPQATVFVDPPQIVDPSLTPGTSFDLNISIMDATELHQWTVTSLFFNNTILNATAVVEGSFLLDVGATTFSATIENAFNATHGRIVATSQLVAGAASGDGDLARITFEVMALGETPVVLADVDLRDQTNAVLPSVTENGYFTNVIVVVRDISVTDVSVYNWVIAQGFTLNVTVRVANHGDLPETFSVTIFADALIAAPSQTVENLPSGGEAELLFLWDTTGYAFGNYTLEAVADLLPGETNTADNTFVYGTIAVIFPGDVNQDNIVDMRDIMLELQNVWRAYNSHPGEPRWNPYADENADGRVDIIDVAIPCVNFMKTLPT